MVQMNALSKFFIISIAEKGPKLICFMEGNRFRDDRAIFVMIYFFLPASTATNYMK